MTGILHNIPPGKAHGVLPSQRDRGIVEEFDWQMDLDGYHVELVRVRWTSNKRRSVVDQRGEPIGHDVLLRLTAQEFARLLSNGTSTLLHLDSRGPKTEEA